MRIKKLIAFALSLVASISFLRLVNISVSAAAVAYNSFGYVESVESKTAAKVSERLDGNHEDTVYGTVSTVSDFFDQNGNYTFAFSDNIYVYVIHTDDTLNAKNTVKLSKKYPLVGGVICDKNGNYYVAYGQDDEKGTGNVITFSVAKYNGSGSFVGSCDYRTDTKDTGDYNEYLEYRGSWATRYPFDFGNCAMAISGNTLFCSYARVMYNGHQSNCISAVNISDMTAIKGYFSYTSHSLDQRVLVLSDGRFIVHDRGDAYDRGFSLSDASSSDEIIPFHFTEAYGNHIYQNTRSETGGIAEIDSGIAMVCSSVKATDLSDVQQLFMQVISKDLKKVVSSGSEHTVKQEGKTFRDTGVIWLTDYDSYEVKNVNMTAVGSNEILIMWENYDNQSRYIDSFYTVIDGNGKRIVDITSLGGIKVNSCEELKYNSKDNCVYWTTADGSKNVVLHRLHIGKAIKISAMPNHAYNGKAKTPDVVIKDGNKTLKLGSDYKLSYENNTELGKAAIKITGKNDYANWSMSAYFNIVLGTPKLTASKVSNTKMTLKWSSVKCPKRYIWETRSYSTSPTSYTIYISANDGVYKKAGTVSGSKTSCTLKKFDFKNNSYKVKIRAYFDGKETYSSIDYDWDSNKWIYPQFYSAYSNVVSVK